MKVNFTRNQILCFTCLFLGMISNAPAENNADVDYFKILAQIRSLPTHATAIQKITDITQEKKIVELINQYSKKTNDTDHVLSLDKDNSITLGSGAYGELYEGDFSNENITEYAIYSYGPISGNSSEITLYKLVKGQLTLFPLYDIISKDLLNGKDVGPNFYNDVSTPFAFTLNGKTYLRYAQYPDSLTYDPTELRTCTYLLQGNKITLAGPNLRYSEKEKKVVDATDCTGDPRAPHE